MAPLKLPQWLPEIPNFPVCSRSDVVVYSVILRQIRYYCELFDFRYPNKSGETVRWNSLGVFPGVFTPKAVFYRSLPDFFLHLCQKAVLNIAIVIDFV